MRLPSFVPGATETRRAKQRYSGNVQLRPFPRLAALLVLHSTEPNLRQRRRLPSFAASRPASAGANRWGQGSINITFQGLIWDEVHV